MTILFLIRGCKRRNVLIFFEQCFEKLNAIGSIEINKTVKDGEGIEIRIDD